MKYPKEYADLIESMFEVIFFVDLETTGLDAMRNEILTASISVCDYQTLEQIEKISLTFKPENLAFWSEEAEKIHGITPQKALLFTDKKTASREMAAFFNKYKKKGTQPLVSHSKLWMGGYFDQNFLFHHFMQYDWEFNFRRICGISQSTIDFTRAILKLENYRLSTVANHFNIPLIHHNAESDREACEQIYRICRQA